MTAILLPPPATDCRQTKDSLASAVGRGLRAVGHWLAQPAPLHQPG